MWQPICLTLAATAGNNIGKVLQKKGTIILPPLCFKLVQESNEVSSLRIFESSNYFLDIVGALMMLWAVSLAPVSLIQPVSGCGLAILSIFSHFYLQEVMNTLDWVGITLVGFGTTRVGIGGEEQEVPALSVFRLPLFLFIVAILFVGSSQYLSSACTKAIDWSMSWMASVISKIGFIFMEQGFSKLLVPICFSVSISCSGTGFVYQTHGFKHGRTIVVSTCAAVASIVTGVLAGIFALGERLPSAPVARLILLLGWLLIVVRVILLVCAARLVSLLPRPWRRHFNKGTERNLRRSASVRGRDANPSNVIQASSLHYLITSPKEKH